MGLPQSTFRRPPRCIDVDSTFRPVAPSSSPDGNAISNIVGKGAFGLVYQRARVGASDGHDARYAVKAMNKMLVLKRGQTSNVFDELRVLSGLPHRPTLVNLYHATQNERELFFIMDLACGGSVGFSLESLGRFELNKVRTLLRDAVDGIGFLHLHNVVHRDVKPDNLLLNARRNRLRIADFNCSMRLSSPPYNEGGAEKEGAAAVVVEGTVASPPATTHVDGWGTQGYRAPEVYARQGGDGFLHACDYFSLGASFFEALTGAVPFPRRPRGRPRSDEGDEIKTGESAARMLVDVKNARLAWPNQSPDDDADALIFKGDDHDARDEADVVDLLRGLLVFEPSERYGCDRYNVGEKVAALRSHAFFSSVDWSDALVENEEEAYDVEGFDPTLDARESLRAFEMSMGAFGFEDVDDDAVEDFELEHSTPTPAQQYVFRKFCYNYDSGDVRDESDVELLRTVAAMEPDEIRAFVLQASDETLDAVALAIRERA